MTEELKPCPFCDGPGEVCPIPIEGDDDCFEVACINMDCPVVLTTGPCTSIEEAVRYWNTRYGEKS